MKTFEEFQYSKSNQGMSFDPTKVCVLFIYDDLTYSTMMLNDKADSLDGYDYMMYQDAILELEKKNENDEYGFLNWSGQSFDDEIPFEKYAEDKDSIVILTGDGNIMFNKKLSPFVSCCADTAMGGTTGIYVGEKQELINQIVHANEEDYGIYFDEEWVEEEGKTIEEVKRELIAEVKKAR